MWSATGALAQLQTRVRLKLGAVRPKREKKKKKGHDIETSIAKFEWLLYFTFCHSSSTSSNLAARGPKARVERWPRFPIKTNKTLQLNWGWGVLASHHSHKHKEATR